MSTHDILRARLLSRVPTGKPRFTPEYLKRLEETEWSPEFERLMRNRMVLGALRYGTLLDKKKSSKDCPWDLIEPIRKKAKLYEQTGNSEYLVDIANYCMLAFECDPHPKKHFKALDDHHDHCKPKK